MSKLVNRWWVAAAVLGLAACGGGGSKLSEDDFVDEVNGICADVSAELDDLGEPADMAELATMAEDAQAIVEDAIAQLEDLGVPDNLADDFDDWLRLKKKQLALYDDIIAAADDEDQDALEEVMTKLADLDTRSNDLAADLNLDDCITEDEPAPPATDAPTTVPTTEATLPPPVTGATTPSASGIDAYGLSEQFAPPLGYTFVDFGQDQLDTLAERLSSDADLAVIDELAGADLTNDSTGDGEASIIVFYADEGIEGTPTDGALMDLALSIDGGSPESITTPGGRSAMLWVDEAGDTQLMATTGSVTIWVLGYTSSYPGADVTAVFDAFLDANAG